MKLRETRLSSVFVSREVSNCHCCPLLPPAAPCCLLLVPCWSSAAPAGSCWFSADSYDTIPSTSLPTCLNFVFRKMRRRLPSFLTLLTAVFSFPLSYCFLHLFALSTLLSPLRPPLSILLPRHLPFSLCPPRPPLPSTLSSTLSFFSSSTSCSFT